ncbi:hypothetical protein D8S46_12275 [Salmonella enterica subsp. enterica serovar Newport]|nr:hypothetical protein [Salmonella enterica]EBZ2011906.1 hypothetical protein [Salmonella enterica subsp. enterica serovar Newport]ECF6083260.1 hypothetical protein [Salmonella enterica subsp. houtenae]EDF7585083.1 hypothetical protein [Salmonella enterica subsp. enterica serovar Newport]EEV4750091.1 hypothetical protein [Salmonella enterica]
MKFKLLDFLFLMLLLGLMYIQHEYIAIVLFYVYSLCHVYPDREKFFIIIKNSLIINFYRVTILFISYILSLKYLSVHMGIDEKYLKFSPTILAIPISLFIVVVVIFIVSMVYSALRILAGQFLMLVPGGVEKLNNTRFIKWGDFSIHIVTVLMLPYFLMVYSIDYVERVSLLADATFISDCGKISNRKMYLRKNNEECYVFALNKNFLTESPSIIKSLANE